MRVRTVLCAVAAVSGFAFAGGTRAHLLYESGGLGAGFAHPFLGWDHLLAMIAAGLWAAQLGGRALWALPLTFVSVMVGGALLGVGGVALPHVEAGIAASLLALGLFVAFATRLHLAAGVAFVAAFALFHGHSHGTELPAMVSAWTYAAGFVAATALLHITGIALGRGLQAKAVKIAGACVALAGVSLLAGM
jgi:urease accessory protein